jgi:hypothetical protein
MVNTARPYIHPLRNGYSYVSCINSLLCLLLASGGVQFEPLIGRLFPFLVGKNSELAVKFNAKTPNGPSRFRLMPKLALDRKPSPCSNRGYPPLYCLPSFRASNGFEPNVTKQNHSYVPIFFLLTFGFKQDEPHSGRTTVLLDNVEALLKQELGKLIQPTGDENLLFVGETQTICHIVMQLYSRGR